MSKAGEEEKPVQKNLIVEATIPFLVAFLAPLDTCPCVGSFSPQNSLLLTFFFSSSAAALGRLVNH
jgi:hypothetical protein